MKTFKITYYEIPAAGKLPRGGSFRLVFISDLHNTEFGKDNEELLDAVEKLQPDGVLIGGDQIIAKPGISLEPGLRTAKRLSERYPVYYACGNHEYRLKLYPEVYGNAYEEFRAFLGKTRITYLENESVRTEFAGCPVRISGFEMKRAYYNRFYRGELPLTELTDALGPADPACYTILLAHHPYFWETYRSYGADLTLSGHYHGGVVGLGRHHGAISPDFRLFPGHCRGKYEWQGRYQIISAGTGEHTVPIRIWNQRELICLDIRA